ncbi:unnamed protein product [Closterium sp. NIES-53]
MAKATSRGYLKVNAECQAQLSARGRLGTCATVHNAVNLAVLAVDLPIMTPIPAATGMIEDTLEARLADVRRRHEAGEFGQVLPLEVVLMGIRALWVTEHPSWPASPRPVRNQGGIDEEVNGGDQVSGSEGMRKRGVIRVANSDVAGNQATCVATLTYDVALPSEVVGGPRRRTM